MNPQIASAIIGALGAIVATLITVYHDEIGAVLLAGGRYDYLKGDWGCIWRVAATADAVERQLDDQISITSVLGGRIRGKGDNSEYGKYEIKGEGSDFAVTLSYCGVGENRLLRGVIILKKLTPQSMSGVWCQYASDGRLKSGATAWTKI